MNEAAKNKMRRFVAGAMAVIMVLTALLMLFVRPKAEECLLHNINAQSCR